ncbi:MAG: hypothetical protein V4671_17330 [Armatimonadota bacterium]
MTNPSKKSDSAVKAKVTGGPPLKEALAGLSRQTGWAIGSLVVRIVAVAALGTILAHQIPWLRQNRVVLDVVGGALVLWPFFTALGRAYAWRIALGRTYAREERWTDAELTLTPFRHPRTRLIFDATGEGIYWLAISRSEMGNKDDAHHLLKRLAGEGRGAWSERAREYLLSSGGPLPGAVR